MSSAPKYTFGKAKRVKMYSLAPVISISSCVSLAKHAFSFDRAVEYVNRTENKVNARLFGDKNALVLKD